MLFIEQVSVKERIKGLRKKRRDENKKEETEGCESKRQSVLADSTHRSGSPSSATPAEHNRAPGFSCGLLQEVMNYT